MMHICKLSNSLLVIKIKLNNFSNNLMIYMYKHNNR